MTFKEYCRRTNIVRRRNDILLLSELLEIYEEYYKSKKKKLDPRIVYNELHDPLNYSEEETKELIIQAQNLIKERS